MNIELILFFVLLIGFSKCPPVPESKDKIENMMDKVHYKDYLKQVFSEIQNDKKLAEKINESDNENLIENSLKYISPEVRSKLDELKRLEMSRLIKMQMEVDKMKREGRNVSTVEFDWEHLDGSNPKTFNADDLKKLIYRTSSLFNSIDNTADRVYKQHAMQREIKKREELNSIKDNKLRKQKLKEWHEQFKKQHSTHKKMFSPGSLDHMKYFWKYRLHMDDEAFTYKNLFNSLDLDGNGYLHDGEVDVFISSEIQKAYEPTSKDLDWAEYYHEASIMRREFTKKLDTDWNRLISLDEFINWTKHPEFLEHIEWKTQEETAPSFSEDEFSNYYKEYVKNHPELNLKDFNVDNRSSTEAP